MANNNPETKVTFKVFNQEFNKALGEMKNQSSKLRQEFKLQEEQLRLNGTETEKLQSKLNNLGQQQNIAQQRVAATAEQLQRAKAMYGENSQEVDKLSRQLTSAQIAEQKLANQLKETQTALSSVEGQTSQTAQGLKRLSQEEKDLANASSKIQAEYALERAALGHNASESDKLRAKLSFLAREEENMSRQIQNVSQQLQLARTQYGSNSSEVQQLEVRLIRLKTAEQNLRNEITRANHELEEQSNVADRARRSLAETGQNMRDVGGTIGTTFTVAGATVGVALGGMVKKAMDFESQMSSVKSVMAPEEVDKFGESLEKLAVKMGADTKYSSIEAAQGIEELIKAGVSVSDIINGGLNGALSLATAGELELADAAEIASTALNAFKDDHISVMRAADLLAGAANASATSVSEMKFSLAAVSSVASGVGLSFEDTATALATFANNGLKGSDAGTSLKTMLMNLTPKTDAQIGAFEELGLGTMNVTAGYNYLVKNGMNPATKTVGDVTEGLMEMAKKMAGAKASTEKQSKEFDKLAKTSGFASSAFYDQNGNIKSMADIAGILQNSLNGLNSEQRQTYLYTMFGSDAIRAANILYKEGSQGITDMATAMNKIKSADVAAEKLNNVKGKIEQLQGAVETAAISFGNALLPVIDKVVAVVQGLVDRFNNLSPSTQQFVAIGAALSAVLLILVGVIGFVTMALGAMAAAEWAVILPIAGIIAAVTAVIAIIATLGFVIYKNWDTIKAKTLEVFEAVKAWLTNTWNSIKATTTSIVTSIQSSISKAWNTIKSTTSTVFNAIKGFFSSVWNGIKSTVISIVSSLVSSALNLYNKFKGSIQTIFNGIKTYFSGVWNLIKNVFLGAILLIVDLAKGNFTKLKSDAQAIFNNLKSALSQIWTGIKQVFSGALSFIKTYTSTVWNGIKSLTSSVWNGIKTVVSSVVNGMKTGVSTAWNGIKSVTNTVWNGLKTFISTTVTNIKTSVTTGFNNLKTSVSTAMNNVKKAIEDGWNKAKTFLTNIDLKSIGKNIVQGLIDGIGGMIGNVKKKIKEMADAVTGGLRKALDIHSPSRETHKIGEHTGQGFANGIAAKKKEAEKQAKKNADAAKKKFSDAMETAQYNFKIGKINSSQYIAELRKIQSEYAKTPDQVRKVNLTIKSVQDKHAKDIKAIEQKSFQDAFKLIKDKAAAGKISIDQEIKQLQALANKYKVNSKERLAVEVEIKKAKDRLLKEQENRLKTSFENEKAIVEKKKYYNQLSLEDELKIYEANIKKYKKGSEQREYYEREIYRVKQDLIKEQFDKEKSVIDNKKYYNELSLTEELAAYEEYIKKYKQGSDERAYYEKEIYRVKKEINDQLTKINDEYTEKVKQANQRLIDSERQLNEEYQKAVNDRAKTLYSFAGLFDEVKQESEVSGQQLLENLKGQVDTFKDWQTSMNELSSKGILGDALIQELQDMGPKAAAEIAALNSLTDEELKDYADLWKEKNSLATSEATKELEGMKADTQAKIEELRAQTSIELDGYKAEWLGKITEIRTGSASEFEKMKLDMKDIGINSMKGLMDGLTSMTEPLMKQASEIADAVSQTIQQALDIHSPSRVMKWMGQMVGDGLIQGMSNKLNGITSMAKQLATAVVPNMNAQYQSSTTDLANSRPTLEQHITINSPTPLSPAETARQNRLILQQAAFKLR